MFRVPKYQSPSTSRCNQLCQIEKLCWTLGLTLPPCVLAKSACAHRSLRLCYVRVLDVVENSLQFRSEFQSGPGFYKDVESQLVLIGPCLFVVLSLSLGGGYYQK